MRVILVVLDSLGVGALPDAYLYNDAGSNTLGNIDRFLEGRLQLPNLRAMGLGNILPLMGIPPFPGSTASFGKSAFVSPGKDTITGHWELAGIQLSSPLLTFPRGFPPAVTDPFERAIGRQVLGNKVASGTEIIHELGEQHMRTGSPILYTSADSVFQLACHEGVVPLETLYSWCQKARELLQGDLSVARVIARPFVGTPGSFRRTPRRRDYSLPPPGITLLDRLVEAGGQVLAVGKVHDIFAGRGISKKIKTSSNEEGILATKELVKASCSGKTLIFTNLVDFDMIYGHRNDALGYARALEEFDAALPDIKKHMGRGDLLVITADHGCDPTHKGTDHTREYVPLLMEGEAVRGGIDLGTLNSLAHVGATMADYLELEPLEMGKSFLKAIRRERG